MANTKRMSTQSAASGARNAAVRRLIAEHTEEFTRILGDERQTRGLPRMNGGMSVEKLESKKAKLMLQLQAIEEKIDHASIG